ncbi:MAG: hypothetical protein C0501_14515 [Isosphaera sp.]|nr:hypothetical protein [Isosphaera sp.]
MSSYLRRLPVYLVLDVSESMAGPAIDAVNRGVRTLVDSLKGNPQALETAYLSVITFARKAEQVVPLTELMRFAPPPLSVRSGSALGAAMRLLRDCIRREVTQTTATTKGDYKPLVFLLTDGQPTDDWEAAARELKMANPRVANVYAIGCGPDVDPDSLREVSDIVLMMNDLSPEGFKKFFVWLSASVQTASVKMERATGPIEMPPLPAGVRVPDEREEFDPTPRQVFLHARCQTTKKPFLMRFGRRPWDGRYEAIASHPLDVLESDAGDFLPPINTSMLDGCPPCPHCENPAAGACPCGTLFCNAVNPKGPVVCPTCRAQLTAGGGGSFDIRRSMG